MMKYAYYPGCSLHTVAQEYNNSLAAVCKTIGIKLLEIPDWICCGSTPAHSTSHLLSIALPIFNCTWAESKGLDIVAPCASCYSRLKIANLEIRADKELNKKINEIIDENYSGKPRILNPLNIFNRIDVLAKLRSSLKRDLSSIRAGCYYGCLLSRPKEVSEEENCEAPQKMDRILSVLGMSVAKWQSKTDCCGAGLAITQPQLALRLASDILTCAEENEIDVIAVACPLCQSNLDLRQKEVSKELGRDINIPIMYFTQLIGMAIGIEPELLGFKQLITSPYPVFEEKCQRVHADNIVGDY